MTNAPLGVVVVFSNSHPKHDFDLVCSRDLTKISMRNVNTAVS